MDGKNFDELAKRFAAGTSRRHVVKGLLGGSIAGAAALMGRGRSDAANKVGICHRTGSASNPYQYIEVSQNAVAAHAAHGDTVNVDLDNDVTNCGACGNVCPSDACSIATCTDGVCGTESVVCDDGNPCTTDSCSVEAGGCVSENNTEPCTTEDGAAGTCGGGTCVPDCVPTITCPLGANCGTVTDECGDVLTCGPEECPNAGETCGGGGIPNVCGTGGDPVCFEADGCNAGGCGPGGSCICGSDRGTGAGFCFNQPCGSACETSADCVDGDGNPIGLCSDNTGGCCTAGDCILFANIDACDVTNGFGIQSVPEPVDRFNP